MADENNDELVTGVADAILNSMGEGEGEGEGETPEEDVVEEGAVLEQGNEESGETPEEKPKVVEKKDDLSPDTIVSLIKSGAPITSVPKAYREAYVKYWNAQRELEKVPPEKKIDNAPDVEGDLLEKLQELDSSGTLGQLGKMLVELKRTLQPEIKRVTEQVNAAENSRIVDRHRNELKAAIEKFKLPQSYGLLIYDHYLASSSQGENVTIEKVAQQFIPTAEFMFQVISQDKDVAQKLVNFLTKKVPATTKKGITPLPGIKGTKKVVDLRDTKGNVASIVDKLLENL